MIQIDLVLESTKLTHCSSPIFFICCLPRILRTVYIRGLANLCCILAERNGFSVGDNNSNKIILFQICGPIFPFQAGIAPDGKIKVTKGLTGFSKRSTTWQNHSTPGAAGKPVSDIFITPWLRCSFNVLFYSKVSDHLSLSPL